MATKKEELTYGSCFQAAADNEPLFILRAQDRLAPAIVRLWAEMLEVVYSNGSNDQQDLQAMQDQQLTKLEETRALADQMEAWQMRNGSKIPD